MMKKYKELPFWAKAFQMTAASSLFPSAVLHFAVNSKFNVQYVYQKEFRIYIEKFDYAVCSQNKKCKIKHLTPPTVDESLQLTKASNVL